ncbi:MAG: beta-galactosidase [Planctomycetota bacterium]|nr:beta-galactosidase [Planctomycetota bacterium]
MPVIAADAHSFSIDGHRLWLASGVVPYHRVPRQAWDQRLAMARLAGLNCVETPVVWALHEPRPGKFAFDGELDLPAYLRAAAARKLSVIVRVGPYVGEAFDMGGLPPWLLPAAAHKLRSSAPEFLAAASRFLSTLCDKIRDLQATQTRKAAGPIVAVVSEFQWYCGDPKQAQDYLGELSRYLREYGITVPIIGSHNLFASVEGEIDAWSGAHHLQANMRQLRDMRPDRPPMVISLPLSEPASVGRPAPTPLSPDALMRTLGECLAAGAQFNVAPFAAGPNPGFMGGRLADAPDAFAAATPYPAAPLDDAGAPTPHFHALRRVATFATSFPAVFAGFTPGDFPAALALETPAAGPLSAKKARPSATSVSIVERRGGQGSVIFIFAPLPPAEAQRRGTILLRDGSTLPFDLGRQPLGWILMNTHLVDRAVLDYCNLSIVGLTGRTLVCYGPAGAPGVLSINGAALEIIVPETPGYHVQEHEGVTLVVLNEDTVDTAYIDPQGVWIGVSGVSPDHDPLPHPDFKKFARVTHTGKLSVGPAPAALKPRPRVAAVEWAAASTDDLTSGASERFASIEAPDTMQALGSPLGYGWYRMHHKHAPARTVKAGFFDLADRAHVFIDGKAVAVAGQGPGAQGDVVPLSLPAGEHSVVFLVDNMGRTSEGNAMGEPKGLYGPVCVVAPLKVAAPKLEVAPPIEPLSYRSPIFGLDEGDVTDGRRLTWKLQHRRKSGVTFVIDRSPCTGLVLLNNEPIAVLSRGTRHRISLTADQIGKQTATLQLALVGDAESLAPSFRESVEFWESEQALAAKGSWAFARWEPPAASKFRPLASAKAASAFKGKPVWYRCRFRSDPGAGALYFDASGLSKGQLYLNGRNLCRYFVTTRAGKPVPPQTLHVLPDAWLATAELNELLIFDEHGCPPDKTRFVIS